MTVEYLHKARLRRRAKDGGILITGGFNVGRIRLDSANDSSEVSTSKNEQPKAVRQNGDPFVS